MYFNDVHILYYVLIGIIGLLVGQFIDWCNKRLPEGKKVFSKEIAKEYKETFKPNYLLMFVTSFIYIMLLYHCGLQQGIIENLNLIKYLILTPLLLSVMIIDHKKQIIPNRLVLTIFEIGLLFAFIYGISDINIAMTKILGMVVGAGIFLIITLIGGLIYEKDSMGFGDIKLIGALGLYFGSSSIITISIMSFLIGAIVSIFLIIIRKRKVNEYIAFGTFIALSSFISMFVPFGTILIILLKIFTLGLYKA